jgi:hypothetical protein
MDLRLVTLATAVVVIAGCSAGAPAAGTPASTSSPPPATGTGAGEDGEVALLPDEAGEHTLGDVIKLSGGEFVGDQARLTVIEAVRLAATSETPEYAFLVEIEGLDAETTPYNALDFSMFDDESFEYQPESGGRQPELTFGNLATGERVKGWLTFDGPSEAAYLELEYEPVMALEAARVRVRLP